MLGKEIIRLDEIDSTNSFLSSLLKQGSVEEGIVVVASMQTLGRGQVSNTWESEEGKNVLMSVLLLPDFINATEQFLISKVVSIAFAESVCEFVDLNRVKIKWPNDIYVDDYKIAGILIENNIRGTKISASVVGVGLNVNQEKFSESIPNPTSLKLVANKEFDLADVLSQVLMKLDFWYNELRNQNFEEIGKRYLDLMYRFNIEARFKDGTGEFIGRITGVNQYGMLCLVDDKDLARQYSFKEIEFLF